MVEREAVSTFNGREGRYGYDAKILRDSPVGFVPFPIALRPALVSLGPLFASD